MEKHNISLNRPPEIVILLLDSFLEKDVERGE